MKQMKKALAILCAAAMLVTVLPLGAFAAPTTIHITQYADGWENWGGGSYGNATQLLIQMNEDGDDSPSYLYNNRGSFDFEITLVADSTGVSKTIRMDPSSAYLADDWGILRFETCEGVAPNRFVPTYGETYTVTLNVYEGNTLRFTGSSDGYYCGMRPLYHGEVAASEPNGTPYSSWGSDPVYLGENRFSVEFYDDMAYDVQVGDRWSVVYSERRYLVTVTELPDPEDGYFLVFEIESACHFGHGKNYTIYLEGCSGNALGYYFPITFQTEAVDYADILLTPYDSGWENGSNTSAGYTTQLLLNVENTDDCIAYDLYAMRNTAAWSLRIIGELRDVTLSLKPASYYNGENWGILRFETAECATPFVPVYGVSYRVELTVTDVNGMVYFGAADDFTCNMIPYAEGEYQDLRDTLVKSEWSVNNQTYVSYSALGAVPVYSGPTPTKTGDARYTYVFSGWDHEPKAATTNQSFVAIFEKIPAEYTVTFTVNGETYEQTCGYGIVPTFAGSTEKTDPEGKYLYTFKGWSPALHPTVGEDHYEAVYEVTEIGSLTVTPSAVLEGGTVTVTVDVTGNTDGYSGFSFGLSYDPSRLTLTGATVLPEGYSYVNTQTTGEVNVGWTSLTDCTTDGSVARFTFAVSDGAEGDATFAVTKKEGRDSFFRTVGYTEEEIYFTAGECSVTLSSLLWGDINGDGTISVIDVTYLLKYLSKSPYPNTVTALVDVNGDGTVSILDVTALLNVLQR